MYPEQQRFWTALLNLQRTWGSDAAAMAFIPPRFRDFTSKPDWPQPKAEAYLLNNLEFLRDSYRQLEAGEPVDFDFLNHGLADLRLRLQPWTDPAALARASRAKMELGGRLEILQVLPDMPESNPGTRYIRSTIQRGFYYFAQYVDHRLSDPAYPGVSPDRMQVRERSDQSGDLVLVVPAAESSSGAAPSQETAGS